MNLRSCRVYDVPTNILVLLIVIVGAMHRGRRHYPLSRPDAEVRSVKREDIARLDRLLPLSAAPVLHDQPDWRTYIRSHHDVFLEEYDAFVLKAAAPLHRASVGIVASCDVFDKWNTIILRLFDRDTDYALMFPNTMKVLNVTERVSSIIFSTLSPGAHLVAHRGMSRTVLRYHLGLRVPHDNNNCHITLWDENKVMYRHAWEDGKDVVFDDNYLHEVVNHTAEPRTILFLDIKREFDTNEFNELRDIIMKLARDSVDNNEIYAINAEAPKVTY